MVRPPPCLDDRQHGTVAMTVLLAPPLRSPCLPHYECAHACDGAHPHPLPPPSHPLQSGIDVSDALLAVYEQVKLKKAHKYFTFALEKKGKVGNTDVYDWAILAKADPVSDDKNQEAFAALVKSLPESEPLFVVFDFTDSKADGRQIKKLVLIKWCPDNVHFRLKPVIGATYQVRRCGGGAHSVHRHYPTPPTASHRRSRRSCRAWGRISRRWTRLTSTTR